MKIAAAFKACHIWFLIFDHGECFLNWFECWNELYRASYLVFSVILSIEKLRNHHVLRSETYINDFAGNFTRDLSLSTGLISFDKSSTIWYTQVSDWCLRIDLSFELEIVFIELIILNTMPSVVWKESQRQGEEIAAQLNFKLTDDRNG